MNRNSTTTALPLKLDSRIGAPTGLVIVNSGALRDRVDCACAGAPLRRYPGPQLKPAREQCGRIGRFA